MQMQCHCGTIEDLFKSLQLNYCTNSSYYCTGCYQLTREGFLVSQEHCS